MKKLVDLSQEIYQGMPIFPSHLQTVVFDWATHEKTSGAFESDMSYATKGILINDNGPTHVDSFSHLIPGGESIAEMPLDLFWGQGLCLDLSFKGDNEYITPEDLEGALAKSTQEWREGMVMLLHTGHAEKYKDQADYSLKYPGLDAEAAEWIREKNPKVFGVDNPSPDNPVSRTYPVHLMCRKHKMTHYENLCNLGELLDQPFMFYGFPLKVREAHGGPTRAVAMIE